MMAIEAAGFVFPAIVAQIQFGPRKAFRAVFAAPSADALAALRLNARCGLSCAVSLCGGQPWEAKIKSFDVVRRSDLQSPEDCGLMVDLSAVENRGPAQ